MKVNLFIEMFLRLGVTWSHCVSLLCVVHLNFGYFQVARFKLGPLRNGYFHSLAWLGGQSVCKASHLSALSEISDHLNHILLEHWGDPESFEHWVTQEPKTELVPKERVGLSQQLTFHTFGKHTLVGQRDHVVRPLSLGTKLTVK